MHLALGFASKGTAMLFMIVGFLKPDVEDRLIALHNEFNEHLAQPYRPIAAAGVLRDADGKRCGYLAFLEADSIQEARDFHDRSPLYTEALLERSEVLQYDVQIGEIG